jgi:hypothetical protein
VGPNAGPTGYVLLLIIFLVCCLVHLFPLLRQL